MKNKLSKMTSDVMALNGKRPFCSPGDCSQI